MEYVLSVLKNKLTEQVLLRDGLRKSIRRKNNPIQDVMKRWIKESNSNIKELKKAITKLSLV